MANILVGVTGWNCRLIKRQNCELGMESRGMQCCCVMTQAAQQFITAVDLADAIR